MSAQSLVLLEYLVKNGSQRVVQQCKDNIFSIETLKDFQFIDKDEKDHGALGKKNLFICCCVPFVYNRVILLSLNNTVEFF